MDILWNPEIIFFMKILIFLEQFKTEGTEIFHIPSGHTHVSRLPQQSGTLVTTDESTLMHHNHPKPTVYITLLWFTRGSVHSMGLDKCTLTCTHSYGIRVFSLP